VLTRLTATTDGHPDPLALAHVTNPSVSENLSHVLSKAMSIGRNQRFASAMEMRNALRGLEIPHHHEPELAATIVVTKTTRESDEVETLIQPSSVTATPLALATGHPSNVAEAAPPEPEVEIPSATMFEEPMDGFDRVGSFRVVGIGVLILIGTMLLVVVIASLVDFS
jgi:hypothetical protein